MQLRSVYSKQQLLGLTNFLWVSAHTQFFALLIKIFYMYFDSGFAGLVFAYAGIYI